MAVLAPDEWLPCCGRANNASIIDETRPDVNSTLHRRFHVSDNDGRQQQNLVPGDGSFDFGDFFGILITRVYATELALLAPGTLQGTR